MTRATVVVKVGGREVARRQVRVQDGMTLELDVPLSAVTGRCGDDIAATARLPRAQFRATTGEEKKKGSTA